MLNIPVKIAEELNCRPQQVEAVMQLLDEGATIPFIARYRKEVHGGLDDTQLRNLEERLGYLTELEERRQTVLAAIEEQDKLTPAVIGHPYIALDYHGEADFPRLDFVLTRFAEGLADFRERRFSAAARAFGEVVRIKPNDKPSVIYLQRCLEYGEREPPADWDGVVELRSK